MIDYTNPKKFEYELAEWMFDCTKEKLSVSDVLVYSVIFSVSQWDFEVFIGNAEFIGACTNLPSSSVIECLQKLLRIKAIEKRTIKVGEKIYNGYVHSDQFIEAYCI